MAERIPVPRDPENDYTRGAAQMRREFASERTGIDLDHVGSGGVDRQIQPRCGEQCR